MRHFYTDLIGLDEVYFEGGDEGSVAYDCDGLQFTVIVDDSATATEVHWARQPGWQGGTLPAISWSITVPEADYASVVARLADSGVRTRHDSPKWLNYWSFPVQDPMGNTVEVVCSPEAAPSGGEWRQTS